MMDIIVCAGANLFRMYVTYRFIRIFLEETKLSRVKEVACYLLFWIVNMILFLRFNLAWVNVICTLIGISLLVRMYTKMWKENIFVTFSIYAVGMACDVFVTLLDEKFKNMGIVKLVLRLVIFCFSIWDYSNRYNFIYHATFLH